MALSNVLVELVLPVVRFFTFLALIGPLILVSSLMIFFITNACEYTLAVLALVGLLSSVRSKMHHQISLLREGATAVLVRALKEL